jgi:HSP20 family molecular chaperone IbpA
MSSISIRPQNSSSQLAPLSSAGRSNQRSEQTSQKRAREAENEANRRILEAEDRVLEQQRASEQKIEEMRDEYSDRMDVERARQEGAIIEERSEGQERVGEVKRKQREELNSVRQEGDRQLDQLQRHYRDTAYRLYRDGEKSLKDLQSRNAVAQNHELLASNLSQEQARQNQSTQIELLKDHQDEQIRDLNQTYRQELERLREKTGEATQLADESYTQTFRSLSDKQQGLIDQLDSRTARQLEALRLAHTERLSAYDSRAEDQFYRMKNLSASMEEMEDSYIIKAIIPEHERKNLSVSVQGSTVTLTNQRRSQESAEMEAGRKTATSNYQIITESFPLAMAVDSRGVTREFIGDEFIVRIPKKTTYQPHREPAGTPKKTAPELMRADRPRFPDNLPVNQSELARRITESRLPEGPAGSRDRTNAGAAELEPRLKRKIPGSGTLT